MQLTFAGTVIAKEPTEGDDGTDAISGFLPKRNALVQSIQYLRAKNAFPMSRFNRARTLSGRIVPAPYPDLETACQAMLLYLDTLPDFGTLQVKAGTKTTVYPQACLKIVDGVDHKGVTIAVTISFEVGPGYDSASTALLSQAGTQLLNQDGTPLFP